MELDEIFGKISAQMVGGMMIHDQMARYYDFLNLHGYKRMHEHYYIKETLENRRLHRYYINRFNKLVMEQDITNKSAIPDDWYRYTRQEVDTATKKNAVRSGFVKWLKWEYETRKLYVDMYEELEKTGEAAAAEYVCKLIKCVDKEIKCAERKQLDLETTGYDIVYITEIQHKLHKKYKEKSAI